MTTDASFLVPDLHRLLALLKTHDERRADAIAARIARAKAEDGGHPGEWAALCARLGVTQGGQMPPATITYQYDFQSTPARPVLRADPVYLRADPSRLVLFSSRHLGVEADEADEYIASLNAVFESDGLRFFRNPGGERWYVEGEDLPALDIEACYELDGEVLEPDFSDRQEMGSLKTVLTEVQMLLHSHDANQRRDARGLPPVNSVWFCGGGTVEGTVSDRISALFSDDADIVAAASGLGVQQVIHAASDDASQRVSKGALVVLCNKDADAASQFASLFEQALSALDRGELAAIRVADRSRQYTLTRNQRWRLWRRASHFWQSVQVATHP